MVVRLKKIKKSKFSMCWSRDRPPSCVDGHPFCGGWGEVSWRDQLTSVLHNPNFVLSIILPIIRRFLRVFLVSRYTSALTTIILALKNNWTSFSTWSFIWLLLGVATKIINLESYFFRRCFLSLEKWSCKRNAFLLGNFIFLKVNHFSTFFMKQKLKQNESYWSLFSISL